MASRRSSEKRRRPASRSRAGKGGSPDALRLLKEDHERVKTLVERFEKARGEEQKARLAETICTELKIHAQIEEEILYPAARDALEDGELVDEAEVEHETAKQLIAEIERGRPGEPLFDAKVKVLGEYVQHHVREEENELFPELEDAELDLRAIGRRLRERRQQLRARGGGERPMRPSGDRAGAIA